MVHNNYVRIASLDHRKSTTRRMTGKYKCCFILATVIYATTFPVIVWKLFHSFTHRYDSSKNRPHSHVSRLMSTFSCNIVPLKILVLVASKVTRRDQRNKIRTTWGMKPSEFVPQNDYKMLFVLGVLNDNEDMAEIFEEGMRHRDLVFGNFSDTDKNSPLKAETIFEYASKHCTFEYLIKVGENVFLNLLNLVNLLQQPSMPKHNLYLGHALTWGEGENHFQNVRRTVGDRSVTYCDGGAFVLSADLVTKLVPHFKNKVEEDNEDEYVGALVRMAGSRPTHSPYFKLEATDSCQYDDKAIVLSSSSEIKKNCMETLFFTMVSNNYEHPFVTFHYIMPVMHMSTTASPLKLKGTKAMEL